MTKQKYTIKSWKTGEVLYECEAKSLKECVVSAVASGADLSVANLSGASLSRANLYGANLYGANLSGADLSGATLCNAEFKKTKISF